jgi:hypothetical protein
MDPYLEDSDIWPGFHHSLADEIKAHLNPLIGPKYYAEVEVRTVAEDVTIAAGRTIYPDTVVVERVKADIASQTGPMAVAVAIPEAPIQRLVLAPGQIKLRTVRIQLTESDQLVTAIEILSPFNKRQGEGLEEYRRKRAWILQSPVHVVEIDLLRGGMRPGREVNEPPLEADYILLVNRGDAGDYRLSEIWPVTLNEPLPLIPVPLLSPDPDAPLDLGVAIKSVYTRAGYDWRIDYKRSVPPPNLRPEMADWLRHQLPEIASSVNDLKQ